MPLTHRQRCDYIGIRAAELTLIRAGHHLWAQLKEIAAPGASARERRPLYEALQLIWNAKKALRADLMARKAERRLQAKGQLKGKTASSHAPPQRPPRRNRPPGSAATSAHP